MNGPAPASSSLARAVRGLCARLDPAADPLVLGAVEQVVNAAGEGHVCLPLDELALRLDPAAGAAVRPEELRGRLLARTALVGRPGDFRPFILDPEGRLYIHRWFQRERACAAILLDLAARRMELENPEAVEAALDRLFPDPRAARQRQAAATALERGLCIISGGPGTGKTHTVRALLRLLFAFAPDPPRVALAAPTGKAAARMTEAFRAAAARGQDGPSLPGSEAFEAWSSGEMTALTLHRLLGGRPGGGFRHGPERPLAATVLVVDEASMIDLDLMHALLKALGPAARLVLLGDRDQLASVAPGRVFGDICAAARPGRKDAEGVGDAGGAGDTGRAGPPPLAPCLAVLEHSFRFAADSGIGALARSVNQGDARRARALLQAGGDGVGLLDPGRATRAIQDLARRFYLPVCQAAGPGRALEELERFRILCALREGPLGVENLNLLVERTLRDLGVDTAEPWYRGRPVLITRNDHLLEVFNGDVGICMPGPDHRERTRVWFPAPGGGLRSLSPVRLPEHETAWAMTIHKSQGSEFDEAAVILPASPSPVLTRELLYTGITRARSRVRVLAPEPMLEQAVRSRTRRRSGLAALLASPQPLSGDRP